MTASAIKQAFRSAPMGSTAAIAYGLEHAPKFTLSALNGALLAVASDLHSHIEDRFFAEKLMTLMSGCGPWRFGPEVAANSRRALDKLPTATAGATLLDPYYFDHAMAYGDDTSREGDVQLFSQAYRLRPCGVLAVNFDPRRDDERVLVDSVVCVAYLRGTDLWGRPELFWAMWQEGLPLGANCLFEMPRWGRLRRANTANTRHAVMQLLEHQCALAFECGAVSADETADVLARCNGDVPLATPVERGFRNLDQTLWFGDEPFPALGDFEYQLIGADMLQRRESVPLWFRPSRAEFLGGQ